MAYVFIKQSSINIMTHVTDYQIIKYFLADYEAIQ